MTQPSLPPGTELGGYLLHEQVGAGGMGTVYRASDADGLTVALKILHPGLAGDPATRLRLEREVQILQHLRVAGVARVLDAELDGPDAFLVTEFINGPTLAADVARHGPLPLPDLANLAAALADLLTQIHAANVIHRDIKPGNVILADDGPCLIDFGIAQEGQATRLTGTGLVIGTPGYVAPELIVGEQPSQACDHWGLAAVLVFAATGRPPFGEGRFDAVLSRITSGQVDLDGVDQTIAQPLQEALVRDPSARLLSGDLADALAWAARGETWPGMKTKAPLIVIPPPIRPATVALAAVPVPAQPSNSIVATPTPPPAWTNPWLVRPAPPKRGWLFGLLALLLIALGSVNGLVSGVIGGMALLFGRTAGRASESLRLRRAKRGARPADRRRNTARLPYYLMRSLVELLPALAIAGGLGYLAQKSFSELLTVKLGWEQATAEHLSATASLTIGLLAGWFGPGRQMTHYGCRLVLGRWTKRAGPALTWTATALALLALLIGGWLTGAKDGAWHWPLS
jgi:hypothetical protein